MREASLAGCVSGVLAPDPSASALATASCSFLLCFPRLLFTLLRRMLIPPSGFWVRFRGAALPSESPVYTVRPLSLLLLLVFASFCLGEDWTVVLAINEVKQDSIHGNRMWPCLEPQAKTLLSEASTERPWHSPLGSNSKRVSLPVSMPDHHGTQANFSSLSQWWPQPRKMGNFKSLQKHTSPSSSSHPHLTPNKWPQSSSLTPRQISKPESLNIQERFPQVINMVV